MSTKNEYANLLKNAEIILLNKKILEYMAMLLLGMKKNLQTVEEINEEDKLPIDANFVGGFTDGETITYVVKKINDDTLKEIITITIHELLHIILFHINRSEGKNWFIWQLASDHVVNRMILQLSSIDSCFSRNFPDSYVYFKELDYKYPNASTEEIYEILLKDDNFKNKQIKFKDKHGKEYEFIESEINGIKKLFPKDLDLLQSDKMTPIEQIEKINDICEDAKNLWNTSNYRGNLPGSLIKYLNNIYKIKVPWENILENAIKYPIQIKNRRTWAWPNIYIRKPKLTGKINSDKKEFSILFGIDSSASILDKDLDKFVSVVYESIHLFKKIIVITHDTKVQDLYEIEVNYKRLEKNDLLKLIPKFHGRGGTSHFDIFKRIEEIIDRENISSILFLTDFASDVKLIYDQFKWIKEYETIWVLNTTGEVILDGCETKTIRIE